MNDINYFVALRNAEEKFPINKRILVCLKESPQMPFKNKFLESYLKEDAYSYYVLELDEISVKINVFSLLNHSPKDQHIILLLDRKVLIDIYFIFEFVDFID